MGRPNPQNLKTPTTEEARRIGRMGGLKNAANVRKKRDLQEMAQAFLSGAISDPDLRKKIAEITGSEELADQEGLILLSVLKEAQGGSIQHAKELWDRAYGKAEQNNKNQVDGEINIKVEQKFIDGD